MDSGNCFGNFVLYGYKGNHVKRNPVKGTYGSKLCHYKPFGLTMAWLALVRDLGHGRRPFKILPLTFNLQVKN